MNRELKLFKGFTLNKIAPSDSSNIRSQPRETIWRQELWMKKEKELF